MKAFVALAPKKASFQEVDIPELKSDEVLVKIKYAGICGTDFAIYSGESSFVKNGQIRYPVRFGHEWSGIVERTGSEVSRFKPGDRVVGDNFIACGNCSSCLAGDFNSCTSKRSVGTIDCWNGCFAEYMVMPEKHLYHIPDKVKLIEAALMEPLSVAYGGIKKCDITPDSNVAVIGTGPIGMCAAALAKYKGAGHIVMIGRNSYKLNIAREIGADMIINTDIVDVGEKMLDLTNGRGADFVLEASGAHQNVMQSVSIAAQKGFISLLGFYERKLYGFDIDLLVSKELRITGIMGEFGNMEAVNRIMLNYDFGLEPIITQKIAFDDCPAAFEGEAVSHGTRIKTMIVMTE